MDEASAEPVWIGVAMAIAVHERQLAEHGGGIGVRDGGALESALARPQNAWSYGTIEFASLAATLAFGLARNHPFVDGNKRTAFVISLLFLAVNGFEIAVEREDGIATFLALAAGELTEEELADWFRQHLAAA